MPEIIIGDQFLAKVQPLILAAKDTIKIIIFDWRIHPYVSSDPIGEFNKMLQDAKNRGVKIQAIVSSPIVKKQLEDLGFSANVLHSQKLVHAKMMLIDDQTAVIGSHNYTQSAFTSNLELSVIVNFESADNDLSKFFKNLWPL